MLKRVLFSNAAAAVVGLVILLSVGITTHSNPPSTSPEKTVAYGSILGGSVWLTIARKLEAAGRRKQKSA